MTADWARLRDAVRDRRVEMRLSQPQLARKAGVSLATLRKVESGAPHQLLDVKVAQIEAALGWPNGAIADVLAGKEPPVPAAERVEVDGEVIELMRELRPEEREQALDVLRRYVVPAIRAERERDGR